MDLLPYLAILAVQGLIIGALARLALPGRDPMGLLATMGVGLAGAFIAGLLYYLISDGRAVGGGFFAAFLFAVAIMYLIRRRRGGGLLSPGAHAPRKPGPYER